jgi:hypothetical protein
MTFCPQSLKHPKMQQIRPQPEQMPGRERRRRRPQTIPREQRPGDRPFGALRHQTSRPGQHHLGGGLHSPGLRRHEDLRHDERDCDQLRVIRVLENVPHTLYMT